MKNNNILALIS